MCAMLIFNCNFAKKSWTNIVTGCMAIDKVRGITTKIKVKNIRWAIGRVGNGNRYSLGVDEADTSHVVDPKIESRMKK